MRYDVTVNLKDARGKAQEPQLHVIDLAPLYGLTRIDEYGIHHAAKALREIQQTVKKWSGTHERLKVWVRDEDRDRLDREVDAFWTGRRRHWERGDPRTSSWRWDGARSCGPSLEA